MTDISYIPLSSRVKTCEGDGEVVDHVFVDYSGAIVKPGSDAYRMRVLQYGIKMDKLPDDVKHGDYNNDILYYHHSKVEQLQ